jgi:hypothetical protein
MEMPDLPPSEKRSEERKQLKFWIERCHSLEEEVTELRQEALNLATSESLCKSILHNWFPEVMAARSESYFAAGWLVDLDIKLSEMDQDIHDAAMILGEIPTRWDIDTEPQSAIRRIYP